MTKKMTLFAIPVLAAILVGGTVLPSFANDVVICDNFITGTIDADVVVPAGETCLISSATINGNFSSDGAVLIIISQGLGPIIVNGNIHIINAGTITTDGGFVASVSGNVKIEDTNSVHLSNFEIGKNLTAENNQSVFLLDTDVAKNAKCLNNGSVTGIGNTYGKNNNGCPV